MHSVSRSLNLRDAELLLMSFSSDSKFIGHVSGSEKAKLSPKRRRRKNFIRVCVFC